MNKKLLSTIIILSFTIFQSVFTQTNTPVYHLNSGVQHDQYGRLIKQGDQRIEFTAEETSPLLIEKTYQSINIQKSVTDNTIVCDANWKQAVMGSCIGLNSMNSDDFDNDGKIEIICSGGSGFSGGQFWYILEYNPVSTEYEMVWVSPYYEGGFYSAGISVITYFDLGNNGSWEICCGLSDGTLLIYDGANMDLLQTISTDADDIHAVFLADADNDGVDEIVFCDESDTYLYNAINFELENILQYGADDFEPGNVDTDPGIELVYSNGNVISFDEGTVNYIWNFVAGSSYEGHVELSDIDSDGMNEIIFAKYWYAITVYDVDIQSPKYEIQSDLDIDALLAYDVNGDGIEEILYGDGQWGDIYCYNSQTTALIWNINNPEHGTTEINVADADNDGQLEVMWGAGCSSTGSDHLFIHEIPSCNFEYKTKHLDPPFFTVEVGDVDDDGIQEIVTISYESNSGYDSGIMTIFSSDDHTIEWQCDENYFGNAWTGIYAMEIEDIDNDNQTEIIVASGQTYTGRIWIINGATHQIESDHIFSTEDIDEFYTLDVADVDNDGQKECIVGESGYVHVVDPTNFNVEWSSVNLPGYYNPRALFVDNIDADANQEIISCSGYIYVIDGTTHQQWQSVSSNYNNIDIFDVSGDGIKDIVACSSTGVITAIDGQTHQTTILFSANEDEIDGVRVDDITGDGEFDFVYTIGGAIYFRTQSGLEMNTQPFGTMAGLSDGLKISDYDQNGWKEIIAGTNYIVVELGDNCYNCLDFDIILQGEDVSCNPGNDGMVEVIASGGEEPYTYDWDFGGTNAVETDLDAGTYHVTVTDNQGCVKSGEITIYQSQLLTEVSTQKVGCSGLDDGKATVQILIGHPPYQFNWNTGATTQTINGLAVGDYSVSINDSQNCTSSHDVSIVKDTLIYIINTYDIECYGYNNGYASVDIYEGEPPFTYLWSTGYTGSSIANLSAGDYTLTVTDTLLCSATSYFTISEPLEIQVSHTTVADDPSTIQGEGSATVQVTGGNPPYFFQWNDPYYQTNQTATNLVSGTYTVVVSDVTQCSTSHILFVPEINAVLENNLKNYIRIYPNPANETVNIEIDLKQPDIVNLSIYNTMGDKLIETSQFNLANQPDQIDISTLPSGLYFIKIRIKDTTGIWKLSVL
ncbi:MAG: T9SS type A sorting domain-containing protein [Bacteroidetes bacterium]|nr:T9SS type A sorting domain-containing protein [Bacteroidota bacterium]